MKINKNEIVENKIKKLNKEKESINIKFLDNLQDYAVLKSDSKFSFSKKPIDEKITNKKLKTKKQLSKINCSYDKEIARFKNIQNNFWLIFITQFLRVIGITNLFKSFAKVVNQNKLMIIIFLISLISGIIKPVFFTKFNIMNNILKNNVTIGIMAIGMTFVIITGGIDLSVGSILGFTGLFSMGLILNGMNSLLAFMIGFLIAALLGAVQGMLISIIKLPPFIVTLVGLLSIRGASYIYAEGEPKTNIGNSVFDFINNKDFIGIPVLVLILIFLAAIGIFVLKYTKFGKRVYAVGGNRKAAELSGINVKKIIMICYIISGLAAGIAALAFVSKISSAGPTSGTSYELDVIAAVVLGGTSLVGGKGGVGKTLLGWLVISILGNALIILGYDSNWQLVFKGIVILVAVILDKNFKTIKTIKKILIKLF